MDKTLGKEYENPRERKAFLKDNCDCVVKKGYMKSFGHEKLVAFKEELAEVSIKINDLETAKKAAMSSFTASMKEPKERCGVLLRNIQQKAEYVDEECFKFIDEEARMVGFYNADGDLIESRPANPDELQGTIFQQLGRAKTGTDN